MKPMSSTPAERKPSLPLVRKGFLISGELAPRIPEGGLLADLLNQSILHPEDWAATPAELQKVIAACTHRAALLELLVEHCLLTEYQASRINAGKMLGLVLGNYRVLDRIGAGGMGVVFKGEHLRMRHKVAIKVLPLSAEQDPQMLQRFYSEMRAVAQLQHPNIVAAMDAGEVVSDDPDAPVLHYFVMEHIEGRDLESYVEENGILPEGKACDLIYQVASALAEAHEHNLVHRDIKPSNVIVTPAEQAKLLDFGLAMHFRNRMTEPGTVLGTVDYIAPEQARDSSSVDIRADIYGLGGTLWFCLTGRPPFPAGPSLTADLAARLTQPVPSIRIHRPDVSVELEAVIGRMMAINPDDRYANPQTVMRALLHFFSKDNQIIRLPGRDGSEVSVAAAPTSGGRVRQILIVDDEAEIRSLCQYALRSDTVHCDEAENGVDALAAFGPKTYDLVLLDIDMPRMNGMEVVQRLRSHPPCPNLKIIMFSGRSTVEQMSGLLLAGADDFITKPFTLIELQARIKSALSLKEAQDRTDRINKYLLSMNAELENNLAARDSDLIHARNALVLALAKLVENRHTETGAHLMRMQRYCRVLAEETAQLPAFAETIDMNFIQMLECCAPLHDIGKVALPDHILTKPGKLTADERMLMQEHTIIGAETLQEVARHHGAALAFLGMAIDICRHHHERWDGTGYPDRLAGTAIPLPARLVTIADVYDALRSRRVYKPALSHSAAMQIMADGSVGQFDPALVPMLHRCAARFEMIFRELSD